MLLKRVTWYSSSVVASWTSTLKKAGSNLIETFYFIDIVTILYISRLKAPGSNTLNNSRGVDTGGEVYHSTTVCLGFFIYHYSIFRGFEPGVFKKDKNINDRF